MKRAMMLPSLLVFVSLAIAQSPSSPAPAGASEWKARVAGLPRHAGFIPYYWDEKKGQLLFELSPQAQSREFLYFVALGSGVGSIDLFADRSSFGPAALCRF